MTIIINEESQDFPRSLTVAELLEQLGRDPQRLAVEVNQTAIRRDEHIRHQLCDGDKVEIVTLVGGGSGDPPPPTDKPLKIGKFTFASRLFTGTGKYATYDQMHDCLAASGCEVTTVAVRRERLVDKEGAISSTISIYPVTRFCRIPLGVSARMMRSATPGSPASYLPILAIPVQTGSSWNVWVIEKRFYPIRSTR